MLGNIELPSIDERYKQNNLWGNPPFLHLGGLANQWQQAQTNARVTTRSPLDISLITENSDTLNKFQGGIFDKETITNLEEKYSDYIVSLFHIKPEGGGELLIYDHILPEDSPFYDPMKYIKGRLAINKKDNAVVVLIEEIPNSPYNNLFTPKLAGVSPESLEESKYFWAGAFSKLSLHGFVQSRKYVDKYDEDTFINGAFRLKTNTPLYVHTQLPGSSESNFSVAFYDGIFHNKPMSFN